MTPRHALAAAAAAGVLALVTAGISAGGGTARTLVLEVRVEKASFVGNDIAPKGHSAGDTFTFSGSVTRAGKAFGRYEDVDVAVDEKIQGVVRNAALLLPDGTLVIQGAGGNVAASGWKPSVGDAFAVVGGTGAYAGARGTVHPKDLSDSVLRLTIQLSP